MFLRFDTPYTMEDSARMIKQTGFSSVMLWWYDNFLQAGFTSNLPSKGKKEEQLVEEMLKSIKECSSINVPIMVMHVTSGKLPPKPNEVGLSRIKLWFML